MGETDYFPAQFRTGTKADGIRLMVYNYWNCTFFWLDENHLQFKVHNFWPAMLAWSFCCLHCKNISDTDLKWNITFSAFMFNLMSNSTLGFLKLVKILFLEIDTGYTQ